MGWGWSPLKGISATRIMDSVKLVLEGDMCSYCFLWWQCGLFFLNSCSCCWRVLLPRCHEIGIWWLFPAQPPWGQAGVIHSLGGGVICQCVCYYIFYNAQFFPMTNTFWVIRENVTILEGFSKNAQNDPIFRNNSRSICRTTKLFSP